MDQDRLALLKRIGEARFTCVELNLYLDTHPDDAAARADFNTYSDKLQALLDTSPAMTTLHSAVGSTPGLRQVKQQASPL